MCLQPSKDSFRKTGVKEGKMLGQKRKKQTPKDTIFIIINYKKENKSTSIFWHSGNCLHDTDKVIFIVTELSKHIKQSASHDLPKKQQSIQLVDCPPIPTSAECRQRNRQNRQGCQAHYTHVLGNDRRAWTLQSWAGRTRQELNLFVRGQPSSIKCLQRQCSSFYR